MNVLNKHSTPCAAVATNQMNVEHCINRGLEKKLQCKIPDMSSVDASHQAWDEIVLKCCS